MNRFIPRLVVCLRIFALFLIIICLKFDASAIATDSIPGHSFFTKSFCSNQLVIIENQIFDQSNPTGEVVLPGASYLGSDSIIHVSLNFYSVPVTILDFDICSNDTVWVNNKAFHAGYYIGEERIENGAYTGCDSLVIVDLKVKNASPAVYRHDTLCETCFIEIAGETYDAQHPSGQVIMKGAAFNGCDSIVIVALNFQSIQIYIPNIFNPDSDWPNNRFFIAAESSVLSIQSIIIADRWGNIVYAEKSLAPNDPDAGWDGTAKGKKLSPAVYSVIIHIENAQGQRFKKHASLTLIR